MCAPYPVSVELSLCVHFSSKLHHVFGDRISGTDCMKRLNYSPVLRSIMKRKRRLSRDSLLPFFAYLFILEAQGRWLLCVLTLTFCVAGRGENRAPGVTHAEQVLCGWVAPLALTLALKGGGLGEKLRLRAENPARLPGWKHGGLLPTFRLGNKGSLPRGVQKKMN